MATRARGKHEDAAATRRYYFNERKVQKEPIPEKTTSVYDAKVPSLGLQLTPSGKRTFRWYRSVNGKLTLRTLGQHPTVSVEVARGMAEDLDDKLETYRKKGFAGANPFASPDVPDVLTLEKLMERYVEGHVVFLKNPEKSAKELREQLMRYVSDWLPRELGEITRTDVLKRYAALGRGVGLKRKPTDGKESGRATANHLTDTLRTLFNWAVDNELFAGPNPAKKPPKKDRFKPNERKRCLTKDELVRLCDAADGYDKGTRDRRDLSHFVLLSLATGQRKKTVLHARWESIDMKERTWKLAANETKNGEKFVVELGSAAMKILRDREQFKTISPVFVFPGSRKDRSVDPRKPRFDFNCEMWRKFLKAAKLDYPRSDERNFRIHDLRHTYVSYQIMAGRSLEQAAAAVGHASVKSTERYAHLVDRNVQKETVLAGEQLIERSMVSARKQLSAEASRG